MPALDNLPQYKWDAFPEQFSVREYFREFGRAIRSNQLDLGVKKHYALNVGLAVLEAIHCGYGKIAVVEVGVAAGKGLLDLCTAAKYFRDNLGIDVRVFGLDNASGLPAPLDYRDHPEIWRAGEYNMGDPASLRAKLPDFAKLMIGDASDLAVEFENELTEDLRLAFVSIDVDYYTSTVSALKMFTYAPEKYLPTVPVYFDDMYDFLTYNEWCGEALAIREFNEQNALRKIQRHDNFNIRHFQALHVLDHPMRTGTERFRFPLRIVPF